MGEETGMRDKIGGRVRVRTMGGMAGMGGKTGVRGLYGRTRKDWCEIGM